LDTNGKIVQFEVIEPRFASEGDGLRSNITTVAYVKSLISDAIDGIEFMPIYFTLHYFMLLTHSACQCPMELLGFEFVL
jgi:hypothetical protein